MSGRVHISKKAIAKPKWSHYAMDAGQNGCSALMPETVFPSYWEGLPMKKSIVLSFVLAASMGLAACGEKAADEAANAEALADNTMEAVSNEAMGAVGDAANAAGSAAEAATNAADAASSAADAAKAAAGAAADAAANKM
jgi:hypothetical protein